MILLVNVVLFIPLNIFNLAIIYLSSRIGLTLNFSFKSFLKVGLYDEILLLQVVKFFF